MGAVEGSLQSAGPLALPNPSHSYLGNYNTCPWNSSASRQFNKAVCLFVCFTILKQILKCDIVYEKETNEKKTVDILMCSDILETKEKEKKRKEKISPKFITLIAVNI